MNDLAPIVLFTYKRLDTLKYTVSSLQKNFLAKDSYLIVFSDAARKPEDARIVEEVRAYLQTINGFKQVIIHEAAHNKGLASSIIDGVTQTINQYGRIIALEDDLITTPNFLNFMNSCLDHYAPYKEVLSVSGYSFNLSKDKSNLADVYLLNRGWSWGWATWKERWNSVDWSVKDYKDFINNKSAQKEFSKGGSDLNSMLQKQMSGDLDSWAIRWFYHQFKTRGLTVYPLTSKIFNNGFDDDATHTRGSGQRYLPTLDTDLKTRFDFPVIVGLSKFYQRKFQIKMGTRARAISKLRSIVKQFLKS